MRYWLTLIPKVRSHICRRPLWAHVDVLFVEILWGFFEAGTRNELVELVGPRAIVHWVLHWRGAGPLRLQLLDGFLARASLRQANKTAPLGLAGVAIAARIAPRAKAPDYLAAFFLETVVQEVIPLGHFCSARSLGFQICEPFCAPERRPIGACVTPCAFGVVDTVPPAHAARPSAAKVTIAGAAHRLKQDVPSERSPYSK